ncbi:MAG TPA: hypothetical protein VK866_10055 [Acidimicrobiales bacterium]|nr:hypothetical protein [Acidimicrobiales bacterium]
MDADLTRIEIEIRPDASLVRLLRLVASGVASLAGMDVDEVDDCRAAVDELCAALIEVGDGGPLHVEFSTDGSIVRVRGSVSAGDGGGLDAARHELSELILGAVVDDHILVVDPPTARFEFSKRAGAQR